ncbi:hypothetical protein [Paenibacillus antarcticus]|uniref:Cytosolic protein n=1 Tax=Paenibacillus antarcticus TaxID=253703 RepID=A0A168JYH0_9BACL|nr:hypothetical protein [Paenibacillus antarcticus]OAB41275.1 hypothetical protein PBAT_22265 [Paenibacillus antarcticus]
MSYDDGFIDEERKQYTDLSTVESQHNDLIAEEFSDGPYGSPVNAETLGKSTPWRSDQRSPNRFDYENRELHAGLEREYPGDDGQGNASLETFNDPKAE